MIFVALLIDEHPIADVTIDPRASFAGVLMSADITGAFASMSCGRMGFTTDIAIVGLLEITSGTSDEIEVTFLFVFIIQV